jgi:malonate transporter
MSAVVDVAVPVFAIMLTGFPAGRFRILGDTSSEALNAFVYWFALPPVLFLYHGIRSGLGCL